MPPVTSAGGWLHDRSFFVGGDPNQACSLIQLRVLRVGKAVRLVAADGSLVDRCWRLCS